MLTMSGATPAAVQRVLSHRDPRITTEVSSLDVATGTLIG